MTQFPARRTKKQVRRGQQSALFGVRSERSTTADLVAVGVITLVIVVFAALTWFTGSAHSASRQDLAHTEKQPVYSPSTKVPGKLEQLWTAPNHRAGAPLVSGGNVYTFDDHGITAWEAGIANKQWTYSRSGDLCAAGFYAERLVTVFSGRAGCSDVTAFSAETGKYAATRQSAFEPRMTLWTTPHHALVLGTDRLEVWRDDLVRTVEYGRVDAPQEKNQQPRKGCRFQSAVPGKSDFAVAELCPDSPQVRLTVSELTPEDSRKPKVRSSEVTDFDEFHLIGLADQSIAIGVARKGEHWSVQRIQAGRTAQRIADLPHGKPQQLPNPATVARDVAQIRWFSGTSTYAFDKNTGNLQWTAEDTTGPGHGLGYRPRDDQNAAAPAVVAVPGRRTLNFVKTESGEIVKTLPFDGQASNGEPVGLSQIGNVLYVQSRNTLQVFKLADS